MRKEKSLIISITDLIKDENLNLENPNLKYLPSSRLYMIYTSGSTGHPKGAGVISVSFMNLMNWFIHEFDVQTNDKLLLFTSLSFDLAQKNMFCTLMCGGKLYLYPEREFNPRYILNIIYKESITLINCTPSAIYPIVELGSQKNYIEMQSLRYVLLGGEEIIIPNIQKWFLSPYCNCVVVNTYGPTECTDVVAFHRINKNNYMGKVPIGRPINNVNLYIIMENNFDGDIIGELYIGGLAVGEGYKELPELTAQKFLNYSDIQETVLYRTGDTVEKLPDNDLLFIGRIDEQVKINGHRIELGEIEFVLSKNPNVKQSALKVHTDEEGVSNLYAYIVLKNRVEYSSIKDYLSALLPSYMIPSQFIEMQELPLNAHGKINKQALLLPIRKYDNELLYCDSDTDGLNATQKRAFEIIVSNLIGKISDNISLDMNFNIVGLDSITFVKIIVALESEFDFDFDDEMLLMAKLPTIRSMIEYVELKTKTE